MTYTCAACGHDFEQVISDEEAEAEARELFPDADPRENLVTVCDVCFEGMTRMFPDLAARRFRRN